MPPAAQPPNAELFAEIYDRHAGEIARYLLRRTARWDLAEDLVAVVFLEAWRRREQVDLAHEHVRAWLFGVAVNVLRNHRRSLRRHDVAVRAATAARPADLSAEEVEARRHDERTAHALLAEIRRLPRLEQEAITLVVWSGLTYEQAATALDVPVGTIRSRLSRARARLRTALTSTLEET